MWLQYLGYESREWVPFPVVLPSQEFSFSRVRGAMHSGKLVIVGFGERLWTTAVPELAGYSYIPLRNPRNPCLTPGNIGTAEFTRLVEALSD